MTFKSSHTLINWNIHKNTFHNKGDNYFPVLSLRDYLNGNVLIVYLCKYII
jgi:hypothetical protein